ncbi:expressed protein [Phakopsora pachyrhizi]|uniref:Expressed protein n=1 Tax=Phakopsora pachyrhizi TaxID=170000 RepID=A0AAV0B8A5_PHAPC|nr:expressed protein [Phakopsora pachyrhizi]CAH7683315.1 expressed protein [Phakopsora pachyrhizi]
MKMDLFERFPDKIGIGRPFVMALQKIFWGVGIFEVLIILPTAVAVYRVKLNRHRMIMPLLLTCWILAWVSLIPFFGRIWPVSLNIQQKYSNVPSGLPMFLCQANALLLSYFWTALAGYQLLFMIELFRLLLRLRKLPVPKDSTLEKPISFKFNPRLGSYSATSVLTYSNSDLEKNPFPKLEPLEKLPLGIQTYEPKLIIPTRNFFSLNSLVSYFPFLTAFGGFFLTFTELVREKFTRIHANQFFCSVASNSGSKHFGILLFLHFVPAFIIGVICIIIYFLLLSGRKTSAFNLERKLISKISVFSFISLGGGVIQFILYLFDDGKIVRQNGYILPMFMIIVQLVAALLFIDSDIIQEWNLWLIKTKNFLTNKKG